MKVRATRGTSVLLAPPDRAPPADGRVAGASHLDRGPSSARERARQDRRGEAARGERAQQDGSPLLQREVDARRGGEPLLHRPKSIAESPRRDDPVRRGAAEGRPGRGPPNVDDLRPTPQALDHEIVRGLTGQQAERGVELRRRRGSPNMSAAMPSRSPTSTPGCAALNRASSPGTSRSPAGWSAPIQIRLAQDAAGARSTVLARAVHLGQCIVERARGQRTAAGLGRAHAAARALEQRRPQLQLELPDLMRQRRLGDVELLRGACEVAVAGDRLDGSQLRGAPHERS